MADSNIEPIDIFVNSGSFINPFYVFYLDQEQTIEVKTLYLANKIYRFQRLNQAGIHPFFISDVGYKQESTKLIFSEDGNFDNGIVNSQSFIVDLSNLGVDDTIYYYCTSHAQMVGVFTLDMYSEPEPEPEPEPEYPGDLDGDLTLTLNDLIFLQAYKDGIYENIDLEMVELISLKHENYNSVEKVNKAIEVLRSYLLLKHEYRFEPEPEPEPEPEVF